MSAEAVPIIDECDLSITSNFCVGPELGCWRCRETYISRYTMLGPRTWALECGECSEVLVTWPANY